MTRSNFDHSNCTHPRTAAGRAACRKARAGKNNAVADMLREGGLNAAVVERLNHDNEPQGTEITRKDAKANVGKWVRVTTMNDQIFSGELLQWGPQVLVIKPDEVTQDMLSRKWKRESVATAAITFVEAFDN